MPVNIDILQAKFQELADQLAFLFQAEILRQGKVASGDLLESVKGEAIATGSGFAIQATGNTYAIFINKGRKPGTKRVPIDAIIGWIRERGLAGGFGDVESLAFAIQQSIYKNGIKPTPIIDQTIQEVLNVFDNKIAESIEQEVSISLFSSLDALERAGK